MKKLKNNFNLKFIFVLVIILLLTSLSSANHENYKFDKKDLIYYPEKYLLVEEKTTKTFFVNDNFDNEKRFSLYDYRNGYSYRKTKEYQENYFNKNYFIKNKNNYNYKNEILLNHRREIKNYNEDFYLKYNPFTKEYKKIVCYHDDPPKKLFYKKC